MLGNLLPGINIEAADLKNYYWSFKFWCWMIVNFMEWFKNELCSINSSFGRLCFGCSWVLRQSQLDSLIIINATLVHKIPNNNNTCDPPATYTVTECLRRHLGLCWWLDMNNWLEIQFITLHLYYGHVYCRCASSISLQPNQQHSITTAKVSSSSSNRVLCLVSISWVCVII